MPLSSARTWQPTPQLRPSDRMGRRDADRLWVPKTQSWLVRPHVPTQQRVGGDQPPGSARSRERGRYRCATNSQSCTDRTTDQPSPTRTEPARRHRGAPRPATGTGQPLRPSASLACSAPPLTSASAVAGPHAVARPHQIRFAISEIRYSLLDTKSKIVAISTILDFRTDPAQRRSEPHRVSRRPRCGCGVVCPLLHDGASMLQQVAALLTGCERLRCAELG